MMSVATFTRMIFLRVSFSQETALYFLWRQKMEFTKDEQGVVARLYEAYKKENLEKEEEDIKVLQDQKRMKNIALRFRLMLTEQEKEEFNVYVKMRDYYEEMKIREAYDEGYKTAMKAVFEGLR